MKWKFWAFSLPMAFLFTLGFLNPRIAFSEIGGQKLLIRYRSDNPTLQNQTLSRLRAFHSGSSEGRLEARYLPLTQTHIVEIPSGADLQSITQALQSNPEIASVEIDQPIHAHSAPNDQFLNLQWALNSGPGTIAAGEAWNMASTSTNILVAVIDSGIDSNHPDIAENLWHNSREIPGNGQDDDANGYIDDSEGYDFFNHDALPYDDFGHGTMVFGVIGAVGNNASGITGIAWKAQVMSLKVLDDQGDSNISTAVEAIEYAIRQGVKIINMSWGYTPNGAPSQTLEEAIQRAQKADILVVTSAGNGFSRSIGSDNDLDPHTANYPSSYPEDNIIAVAATNKADALADFSNYGKNTVDLGAPGVEIYSTSPGNRFQYFTGTSAGAPYITGAAALIWAVNPNLNYSQVKRLILESTDPLSTLQGKTLTGGRLNVAKALLNSPAQGGSLLNTVSPLPTPSTSLSAQEQPGSGGCRISETPPSKFLWMWGLFFLPALILKRGSNRSPMCHRR